MKATVLALVLLLFCIGCTSKQSDELTHQQKDQIKNEVKALNDSALASWQRLDGERVLRYYADTPDWVNFDADGSNLDFQTFKKAVLDFHNIASTYKAITIREDYIVLTRDLVIAIWVGKDELILKSGDRITYDPHSYTTVAKKIAGQWKAVYSHNSGIAVLQKAGKK